MGFLDTITGKTAAGAARDAAGIQAQSAVDARNYVEESSQPYRDLGTNNIQGLQSLIDNPMGYLQNNPMFDAALNSANVNSGNQAALQGKFNSGGMVNSLFNNYLATGDNMINSQYNRLLNPVQMGQNAALTTGGQVSDLITGRANAQASGLVGAANARGAGVGNMLGIGSMLFSGGGKDGKGPSAAENMLKIGGLAFSDSRLKEDIVRHGQDRQGNTLYRFNYKGEDVRYLGYMAQEIQKTDPDNVVLNDNGYLMVTEKYAPVRLS